MCFHTSLVSSFLNHIPLLLLLNWGSFLYRLFFSKSISKAPGQIVVASLSACINVKILRRYANNVKMSTPCSETAPGSTLYLGWRREFQVTEQWASFPRNRNANA